jgi:hypothetical protein
MTEHEEGGHLLRRSAVEEEPFRQGGARRAVRCGETP